MTSFAIIPAAGQSRRMGQPKLLLPWSGATVIDAALRAWTSSDIDEVVVVVRAADSPLRQQCEQHDVQVVTVSDPPQMKDSVIAALLFIQQQFAPAAGDVWLLAPADAPRLSAAVINRLLGEHRAERPEILKPTYQGRSGHPVLFPWPTAPQVLELPADQGIDGLVRSQPVRRIECDEKSVLDDLDTPDDYDLLRRSP